MAPFFYTIRDIFGFARDDLSVNSSTGSTSGKEGLLATSRHSVPLFTRKNN